MEDLKKMKAELAKSPSSPTERYHDVALAKSQADQEKEPIANFPDMVISAEKASLMGTATFGMITLSIS